MRCPREFGGESDWLRPRGQQAKWCCARFLSNSLASASFGWGQFSFPLRRGLHKTFGDKSHRFLFIETWFQLLLCYEYREILAGL
jgi:hypothetical protein